MKAVCSQGQSSVTASCTWRKLGHTLNQTLLLGENIENFSTLGSRKSQIKLALELANLLHYNKSDFSENHCTHL